MNNEKLEKIIHLAAKDTRKGSRVVAKVFYRILRSKGFSENQIIDIATNILDCLIKNIRGNEQQTESAKEHKEEIRIEQTLKEEKVTRTFARVRSRYADNVNVQYSAHL